jgi:hypothetical protein
MSGPVSSFQSFLDKFPPLETPLTLGENTHHTFSSLNEPLPQALTNQFIYPHEEGQMDELTEFVPCFRIANVEKLIALVYWKAGLMDYQYVLLTYTDKGQWLDRKVIAGTYSDGDTLTHSIATIDEDLIITIASGQAEGGQGLDPTSSTIYHLEILPNGTIVNQ